MAVRVYRARIAQTDVLFVLCILSEHDITKDKHKPFPGTQWSLTLWQGKTKASLCSIDRRINEPYENIEFPTQKSREYSAAPSESVAVDRCAHDHRARTSDTAQLARASVLRTTQGVRHWNSVAIFHELTVGLSLCSVHRVCCSHSKGFDSFPVRFSLIGVQVKVPTTYV